MAGALLLTLSLILLGWGAEGQGIKPAQLKVSGASSICLRQNGRSWSPLLRVEFNLSEHTGIKSSFQFRTFDPEGVIFYGDAKDGEDWFVLSLKEGIPLMQISKDGVVVSAAGTPRINDGEWHTLEVSNQGKFVILEVDGSNKLVVGIQLKQEEAPISGSLRLALDGILTDKDNLIVPFDPQMDGCVRNGSWLNRSKQWDAKVDKLWPCYTNIQPGSYFPGTGYAIFNTSDFQIDKDMGLLIDLWGDFSQMNGSVLSIGDHGQQLMCTVVADNNTRVITITFGDTKMRIGNSFNRLKLLFQFHSLIVSQHENESTLIESFISAEKYPDYLTAWKEGHLAFGRLLGETAGENSDGVGSQFLTGCLKKIQVQGKDLDLDSADIKHISVSSYSCPA